MIRKIIISILILHGLYVGFSNSLITDETSRTLEKYDPDLAITESKKLLKEGDMIFRLNMDGYSQFIKKFNKQDKQYSHAGIVVNENGNFFIYHMVNDDSSKNTMSKNSFEEFVNPKKNYAFGIYRNDMTENEVQALVHQTRNWYNEKICFDFHFNLQSDDKMYCSEMIAKAITTASNKRIEINTTQLTSKEAIAIAAYSKLPLSYTKNLEVIAIDNLYKHKWCSVVKEYRFY
jgi:hypothetical protein